MRFCLLLLVSLLGNLAMYFWFGSVTLPPVRPSRSGEVSIEMVFTPPSKASASNNAGVPVTKEKITPPKKEKEQPKPVKPVVTPPKPKPKKEPKPEPKKPESEKIEKKPEPKPEPKKIEKNPDPKPEKKVEPKPKAEEKPVRPPPEVEPKKPINKEPVDKPTPKKTEKTPKKGANPSKPSTARPPSDKRTRGERSPVRLISRIVPRYPEQARLRNQQGTVVLRVTISILGRVSKAGIHKSSGHRILDVEALDHVKRLRFVPAKLDGTPVVSEILVPVRFRIRF